MTPVVPPFFFDTQSLSPDGTKRRARSASFTQITGTEPNCAACGLDRHVQCPKMSPFGEGQSRVLIVAESPGEQEDRQGRPLIGPSGQEASRLLRNVGVEMDRDCKMTNAIQCWPRSRSTSLQNAEYCYPRLRQQIEEFKPRFILCMGALAVQAVLQPPFSDVKIHKYRGRIIPSHIWNCWVGCVFHPAYILRQEYLRHVLAKDLAKMAGFWKHQQLPALPILPVGEHELVTDLKQLSEVFERCREPNVAFTVLDIETSCLWPWEPDAKLLLFSLTCILLDNEGERHRETYVVPCGHQEASWTPEQLQEVMGMLKGFCENPEIPKVVQNAKFEHKWLASLGINLRGVTHDTMIAAHILDERKHTTNLEFLSFSQCGGTHKGMVNPAMLSSTPLAKVAEYCALDTQYEGEIALNQMATMTDDGKQEEAFQVFHQAYPAIARMERRGIRLDLARLQEMRTQLETRIEQSFLGIQSSPLVTQGFGFSGGFKPGSDKVLRGLLFDRLKLHPVGLTPKGQPSVDEAALQQLAEINSRVEGLGSFVKQVLTYRKMRKLLSTYVLGFAQVADQEGLIHPQFGLHRTDTYRSNCEKPNFQNVPRRDPELQRFRKCVVPKNDLFLEVDFKGAEVCVLAMYSHDPVLGQQIIDHHDMHADWAALLFRKVVGEVAGDERFRAKNSFVFPTFYGSYYENTAKNLGLPEQHVQAVELEFWHLYAVTRTWQEFVLQQYMARGYVESLHGFRRRMPLGRTKIINTPVQGTAFHLLLEALMEIDQEFEQRQMKSHACAEIHDSILFDATEDEAGDVLEIATAAMMRKRHEWMGDISMTVSWEIGSNWGEMEAL